MNDGLPRCRKCKFQFDYLNDHVLLCVECAERHSQISQLKALRPSLPRMQIVRWINASFSAREADSCMRLKISLEAAKELRRRGVVASSYVEYSRWVKRMQLTEIVRWSEAGFKPQDEEQVLVIIENGFSPDTGADFLKILGRENLKIISLFHRAGVPINTHTLQRWKGLNLEVVTPEIFLSLIDRGFPAGELTVGFEHVDWDYEVLAELSRDLDLDSPQDLLTAMGVEGLREFLLMQDLGLPIDVSWEWGIRGFLAEEVNDWLAVTDGPAEAVLWANSGFEPLVVNQWKSFGITEPRVASQWKSAGFNHAECREWFDLGFDPEVAAEWRNSGIVPVIAKRRADQGMKPH